MGYEVWEAKSWLHRGGKKQAKRLIHQFFDDLTIASVQQYIEAVNQSRFQMMRTTSHELGNLLNGISASVSLLNLNAIPPFDTSTVTE